MRANVARNRWKFRAGLVLVTHYEHGDPGGLTDSLVQFALSDVLVRHERHLLLVTADRLHQKITLPVDGAEAPLLDFQQLVGDAGRFQPVAKIGGEHPQFLPFGEFRIAPEQALHLSP